MAAGPGRGRSGCRGGGRAAEGAVRVPGGRRGGSGAVGTPGGAGQSIRPRATGAVRGSWEGLTLTPLVSAAGVGGSGLQNYRKKRCLCSAISYFVRPFAVAGRERCLLSQTPVLQLR